MPATPATGSIVFPTGTPPADAIRDYELNEGSGSTATDSGSQTKNGTIINGSWSGSDLVFDGTTEVDADDTGLPTGAAPFSMGVKINCAVPGSTVSLIAFGNGSGNQTAELFLDGAGHLGFSDYAAQFTGTVVLADSTDKYAYLTYDGTTARLYANGVADGSMAFTLNTTLAGTMFIGNDFASQLFTGKASEAQFFARCLTPAEMAAIAGLLPVDAQTIRIQDGQGGDETFTFETTPANPNDFNFDPMGGAFLKDVIDLTAMAMTTAFDSSQTISLTDTVAGTAGNIAMISGLTGVMVTGMAGGTNPTLTGSMFGSRFIRGRA